MRVGPDLSGTSPYATDRGCLRPSGYRQPSSPSAASVITAATPRHSALRFALGASTATPP